MRLNSNISINKQQVFKYGLVLFVLYMLYSWWSKSRQLIQPPNPPVVSALGFFGSEINGDALNFRWSHSTNRWLDVQEAFTAGVHGIAVDVILKKEGTGDVQEIPVLADPPNFDSQFTLKKFLDMVINHNKALIRLDFTSIYSVESSLNLLRQKSEKIDVPVWLSAAVLPGPGSSEAAVDASDFIEKVIALYSFSTLSLSWSVEITSNQSYSWSHMKDMADVVNMNVQNRQPVTFSVSASLLKNSVVPLKWLCEQFNAALIIYHLHAEDFIDFSELVYARHKFPKTNIFYDLPKETRQAFLPIADNLHLLSKDHQLIEKYSVKAEDWILRVSSAKGSELRLSEEVVWLRGPEAQISSVKQASSTNDITIHGLVSFVPLNGTHNTRSKYKSGLQIYMLGAAYSTSHPSGIKVSINSQGRMIISTDHVQGQQVYEDAEVGLSKEGCYRLLVKLVDYSMTFTAEVPEPGGCHTLHMPENSGKPRQLLTYKFSPKGLTTPYHIVIKNCNSDGYAILEQIDVNVKNH